MINIFYQKNQLNDTLVIEVSLNPTSQQKINDKFAIGFDANNKITFINIFNFSRLQDLNSGLIYPDEKIIDLVKSVTEQDISQFVNNGLKIAQILSIEQISGTHLHYCTISLENEKEIKIVCGASNVALDAKVVVATNNTRLPSGKLITEGKVLNYFSQGMLCSSKELGLENNLNTQGIIILPKEAEVGSIYKPAYINL